MPHPDGGPAFPQTSTEYAVPPNCQVTITHGGMTLRDWFAGMALQGMLASFSVSSYTDSVQEAGSVAVAAYLYAEAMLKAREGA